MELFGIRAALRSFESGIIIVVPAEIVRYYYETCWKTRHDNIILSAGILFLGYTVVNSVGYLPSRYRIHGTCNNVGRLNGRLKGWTTCCKSPVLTGRDTVSLRKGECAQWLGDGRVCWNGSNRCAYLVAVVARARRVGNYFLVYIFITSFFFFFVVVIRFTCYGEIDIVHRMKN